MLSINAAMQVDLLAQANASFVDGRIYSGFGGQPDFVTGALHSSGGHAIIALPSWHRKTDSSTVLPILTNPVTSFQHSAMVSEHGCAEIFGRSEHAQAQLIIDHVADPRARLASPRRAGSWACARSTDQSSAPRPRRRLHQRRRGRPGPFPRRTRLGARGGRRRSDSVRRCCLRVSPGLGILESAPPVPAAAVLRRPRPARGKDPVREPRGRPDRCAHSASRPGGRPLLMCEEVPV